MRLFVAIRISEAVKQVVGEVEEAWRARIPRGVRWVNPKLVHLTLHFLGEVAGDTVESLVARLAQSVVGFKPFSLNAQSLGAFPSAAAAQVVFVGVKEPTGQTLFHLHERLARELHQAGLALDRRAWMPHLTIGRLRQPRRVTTDWYHREPVSWVADAVHLIESTLHPDGPVYRTVATAPFTPLDPAPLETLFLTGQAGDERPISSKPSKNPALQGGDLTGFTPPGA